MKSKIRMREGVGRGEGAQLAEETSARPAPSRAAGELSAARPRHPARLASVSRALFVPVLQCDLTGRVHACVGRWRGASLALCAGRRRAGPRRPAAGQLPAERAAGTRALQNPPDKKAVFQIPGTLPRLC